MFIWKKMGKVFDPNIVEGKSWLKEFAQAPCVLIRDDFVRIYFSCRPYPDKNGQYISYSAYIDVKRENLFEIIDIAEKPILELGKLGTFDEFGTYPVSVIEEKDAIIVYYGGWTRCESVPFTVAIGMAKSKDGGKTFQKIGDGPLLASNVKDPYVISGPKIRQYNGKWYLWYVAATQWLENNGKPEAVYKIRMATSDDGINWNRSSENIIENKIEENECQASPDVFFYKNRYHMFFCYKYSLDFRNNERGYRIGYAYSYDLINWKRADELVGIDLSESGWDDQSIAYPHVFELDGEIYMLYLGNHVGKHGFGLARLAEYQEDNINEVGKNR
ncbi:glycosylase [Clostridium sulfidigenes]|uniref:glycosylase n=1 Tax=Clostridium sulfidigenes TaxID=318464 RepID=UPI0006925EBA|nr:glycosylase [Clostridium sulfidigenes]